MKEYKININDFHIPHDKERNYNDLNDGNYIPPYQNANFPSIYKGVVLEMHIVDHCNLNCAGCNHFSPLAKPYFIDLEYFKEQLLAIKNNIPTLKRFLILGGEPSLHPKLFELCTIARQIFPIDQVNISVLINGTITDVIENHITDYEKLNIDFQVCSYPNNTNFKNIEKIKNITHYYNTRIISYQTLVDESGSEDEVYNFFNCTRHQLPCLTVKDFKLYICPFIAHLNHYYQKINKEVPLIEGKDYIDIRDIKNNLDILQDFCFTPKPACKYCARDASLWIWHKSFRDTIEYNTKLNDLYFKDYDRYEKIISPDINYFHKCLDEKENPGVIHRQYAPNVLIYNEKRFGDGKIDIIIPYYELTVEQLEHLAKTLLSQTIINDCIIYFISDNSPIESSIIDLFYNIPKLNCVFLKNKNRMGPGAARNKGLENSYNKYKFFLDADDYFLVNNALETLYNNMENNDFDFIRFEAFSNLENDIANKSCYFIKKDFLDKNNIKFYNLFFGEDYLFSYELYNQKNVKYLELNNKENLYYVYAKKDNNINLSSTFQELDPLHFNFITSKLLPLYLPMNNLDKNYSIIIPSLHIFESFYNNNKYLFKIDFFRTYVYWFWYQLYLINKDIVKDYIYDTSILMDFETNNLYIPLQDKILKSENEIKDYLLNFIQEYYINNPFTAGAANAILSLI